MGNFELYSAGGLNFVEAAVWILIGFYLFFRSKASATGQGKDYLLLSALFLAFGLSDVVEVYSGAWWKPWWLLAWKALNAIGLLYLAGKLYLAERGKP
ncbi:MAG: hypothetical protein A2X32_05485 [Elusimicrobia bacterium GWC2_64_44]|nr:MAG: hypothetical protein A2X32_05485 [Elusimicrobia bacterium GWC2_64_44]